jgi:molybdopterin-guanine dinucleotide biosynthesis protein A
MTQTIVPAAFTAVLLAGGRSTRMGQDKAGLLFQGQPLWELQLSKLRALSPAEILISGHKDGPYSAAGVELVFDPEPGLGPLAGLCAAMQRCTSPLLLVLAIDLPAMTAAYLHSLLAEGRGVVPQNAQWYEPLAAIYPRAALPLLEESLRTSDRSLQQFVRRAVAAGLIEPRAIPSADQPLFRNINTPADHGGLSF